MNRQPWTGSTTPRHAEHEPKVNRRRTPKEQADVEAEAHEAWRRQMVAELWGRP